MDCWPYIFTLFSNQYWRLFVYPSTVPSLLSTGQTRGNVPRVAWLRPRHQGDTCNWGRTHKHRLHSTHAASPVRGVGPQPWLQDAPVAEPIWHQNCIIHFINSQLTYGPGLKNTMELGSYPHWHTNRTSRSRFGAWRSPAALHGGNGLDQVVTGTLDATASSTVSRVQPALRQNYAIQTNHTPTYGALLAGIHHSQGCSLHTGHHCQTGTVRY